MPMLRRPAWRQVINMIFGSIVGGLMFGLVAFTHWSDVVVGVVSGMLIGATLCWGRARGAFGPITMCALTLAVLILIIGPGCDAYGADVALPAACIGALAGYLCKHRRSPQPETSHAETTNANPLC